MKVYEKIRSITASNAGDVFATAEFEETIQVWDSNRLIRVLKTGLDFGGKRFSLSNAGKFLVVGSYEKNSVVSYSVDTGEVVWSRKDLKKCGVIRCIKKAPEMVFVTLEKQGSQIIALEDGSTIGKITEATEYWENKEHGYDVIEKSKSLEWVDEQLQMVRTRPKTTFVVLDACFYETDFLASFSGGPLEFIDSASLKTKWQTKIHGHFLRVGLNKSIKKILGVGWNYNEGGPKTLYYLNPDTGAVDHQVDLGDIIDASFLSNCDFLITTRGSLISIADGKISRELDFENG